MNEGVQESSQAQPVLHYRRIFCNRTLDLASMEAIGFDMVRRLTL
jgi:hypothetical protein